MPSILTLNGGSSSLRFALFSGAQTPERVLAGKFERIGLPNARLAFTDNKQKEERAIDAPNHLACVSMLEELIEKDRGIPPLGGIVHRVVHGGTRYRDPQRVDEAMLHELRRISPFDPEHLPAEIALLEAIGARYPQVPQVACFDTAFHRTLPRVAKLLPIPRRYEAQ